MKLLERLLEVMQLAESDLDEAKQKQIKNRWLNVTNNELAAIASKVRQNECEKIGEHYFIARTSNYWYYVEIMNIENDTPDYYVIAKGKIL